MFGKKVNVKQLESLIDAALVVEKNPEVALELQKLANQLKTSTKIRETEKNGYLAITKTCEYVRIQNQYGIVYVS